MLYLSSYSYSLSYFTCLPWYYVIMHMQAFELYHLGELSLWSSGSSIPLSLFYVFHILHYFFYLSCFIYAPFRHFGVFVLLHVSFLIYSSSSSLEFTLFFLLVILVILLHKLTKFQVNWYFDLPSSSLNNTENINIWTPNNISFNLLNNLSSS